jgi:hypothetical protein
MTILSMLFAVIHDHGLRQYDCTDLIIAADPRHGAFYRRKWDFESVGPAKMSAAFGKALQLLRVRVAAIKPSNDNLRTTGPLYPGAVSLVQAAR